MPGLGTVINVVAIVIGGTAGSLLGARFPRRLQETLTVACGVAVLFIGMAGALAGMLSVTSATGSADGAAGALTSGRTILVVISLVLGALVGELAGLHGLITRFGDWLRRRTGNSGDAGFTDAFVTASVTVCVGAMAVVGAIADGLTGDHSVLLVKAVLDLVIILAMSASMGRGCAFAAIPVGLFQGFFTATAGLIKPLMTPSAQGNLSLVGSILIFCVGLNLLRPGTVRVANLLPALLIAPALAFTPWGL